MNKHMKRWIALALAIAGVAGARYFSAERQLKASEGDGTTTAAEQQAEVKEETKPVEVIVPARVEEEKPVETVEKPVETKKKTKKK